VRRTLILSISLLLFLSLPAFADWQAGVAAFNAGRYETAEAEFRAFLEGSPEAADAYFMLGRTLQRQKRTDDAVAAFGRAVELGDDPSYRLAQSQTQLQAKQPEDALKTLAALDPTALPDALRQAYGKLLAQAATQSSRGEAALDALERAIATDPAARYLQVARADAARKAGRVRTEMEALTAAFDLDLSDTALVRRAFAVAMNAARTSHGAADEWHRAAYQVARRWAESTSAAEAKIAAGEALMGTKSYEEARGWFEKAEAEATNGADAKLLYYLGSCHLAEGQAATALNHLEKALAVAKEPPLRQRILLAKGSALRHLEEFEKAAAVYGEAGDAAKVAEMHRLVKAQEENAKWAAERRECLRKKQVIEETRASISDLEGTPEWEAAEADFSEILAACEPYLREAG
jgi:tetratricopeptide (TPR) repeat protein